VKTADQRIVDRLREFSIVTVSLPDSARVSEFRAYVVGVHREVAALQPVERVELTEPVANVLMSFLHGTQTVGLKGELRVEGAPDDLRFRVTDGVCIPRRRSTRLKLCAPASVTMGNDGIVRACQTHDVGPDGIVLEGLADITLGQRMNLTVMLPESAEPLSARAVVTECDEHLCAVEFVGLDVATRRLLSDFVSEHFRRRLEIIRSLRNGNGDARD
jgi:PilZ domain-containing protein